ncbi:hypothetical protein GCM10010277_74220 [Streptomyces longisporoflavus]|uniref:hypothetical protein n=1 Tax=Streptomyces longisporoflavus TaxID=28044 RepID=UPI00167ECABB|nr:hypothetical protein [Streptomyces longisporoflavus]GGV66467.1 hypothetical protein GCM10010277_74220 [Streptomyces longisporoflavus]
MGTEDGGVLFYARMYAAKAVPLCVLAAVIPLFATGAVAGLCLLGAAASQVMDAAIGSGEATCVRSAAHCRGRRACPGRRPDLVTSVRMLLLPRDVPASDWQLRMSDEW